MPRQNKNQTRADGSMEACAKGQAMISNPQFGYTPDNLKRLRQKYGITQQRMAELLNTNISTARRWETSIDRTSHATMPFIKWVELISILENQS